MVALPPVVDNGLWIGYDCIQNYICVARVAPECWRSPPVATQKFMESSSGEAAMEESWFVYVLDIGEGEFYVGCSVDVQQRIRAHRSGHSTCIDSNTIGYLGCMVFNSKREALDAEKLIQSIANAGRIHELTSELGDFLIRSWPPPERTVPNAFLPKYSVRS